MQVKKFEARTMKEALEMVKSQMGPEAIILSARDNNKKFGLVGQGSVEITAAVPEEKLKMKQYAESKMNATDRDKLSKGTAKIQRAFFEKSVSNYKEENKMRPAITQTRYADIIDEGSLHAEPADVRIKNAARQAWNAMQSQTSLSQKLNQEVVQKKELAPVSPPQIFQQQKDHEIRYLKDELQNLRQILSQFQKVPQTWTTAHPGAEFGLNYEVSSSFDRLVRAGVGAELASEILLQAQKIISPIKLKSTAVVDGWVAKYILDQTLTMGDQPDSRIQFFVGPSGSGKTTSLVKLASHYVVNHHKKVAFVTTDTRKVGAVEQLRIYAQILNVPFVALRSSQDWSYVDQQLADYDYILVDTSGLSLRSPEELEYLRTFFPTHEKKYQTHLVLSSTQKDQDLNDIGGRFGLVGFNDLIFTSLDESIHHGNIFNFVMKYKKPLHSFGIGSRIPEDFEIASRERMLDLIFKLSSKLKR